MSDKHKTLEDLVPPLELCKAAREVIGERTAMVWAHTGRDYEVTSREAWEIIEVCFDAIPAPTLAELLEMLPAGSTGVSSIRDQYHKCVGYQVDSDHPEIGQYDLIEVDKNPATAALWLLMRVKGVGQ